MRALVKAKLKEWIRVLSVLLHILYPPQKNISFEYVPRLNFSFLLVLLLTLVTCLVTFFDQRDPESVYVASSTYLRLLSALVHGRSKYLDSCWRGAKLG